MGDRYEGLMDCVYCGESNEFWYAPTCSSYCFICFKCRKNNFIDMPNNKAKKIEDVTRADVEHAFVMTTNVSWTDEQLKEMIGHDYKMIKGEVK